MKIVTMYSEKNLTDVMEASSLEEYERHQFFLCTGARDEEVQFAFWNDVDFDARKFNVKAKPDLGFYTKGREERSIPIPASLALLLRERRKRYPDAIFIFPAAHGGRNAHFLRSLKKLAYANGLNCGFCTTRVKKHDDGHITGGLSCADHPVCKHWILHRFRKTFATMHYRSGKVTMKTLQLWLGHKSLEDHDVVLGG